jgi:hypothetical protein
MMLTLNIHFSKSPAFTEPSASENKQTFRLPFLLIHQFVRFKILNIPILALELSRTKDQVRPSRRGAAPSAGSIWPAKSSAGC